MDLLDSILNGMEKPPTVKKPVIKDKEQREKFEKMQKERQEAAKKQKDMLDKFRAHMIQRIHKFVNTPMNDDPATYQLKCKPMNQIYRSIVHEVCEEHEDEIVVHSFGTEDVDRHCMIWKRGYEPCEEEIRAMKLGVEYKPKTEDEGQDDVDDHSRRKKKESYPSTSTTDDGKDKYLSQYEKIVGENTSGRVGAQVAQPAKQYGFVTTENKRDQRSIEETLNDMRKKKQKCDQVTAKNSEDSTPKVEVKVEPKVENQDH